MLNDDRKKQLDEIVAQAFQKGIPQDHIQGIVDDFKGKYDTPEKKADSRSVQKLPEESIKDFVMRRASNELPGIVNPIAGIAGKGEDIRRLFGGESFSDVAQNPTPTNLSSITQAANASFGPAYSGSVAGTRYLGQKLGMGEEKGFGQNLNDVLSELQQQQVENPIQSAVGTGLGLVNPMGIAQQTTNLAAQGIQNPIVRNITGNVLAGQALMDPRAEASQRALQGGIDTILGGASGGLEKALEPPTGGFVKNAIPEAVNAREQLKINTGMEIPAAPDSLTESSPKDIIGNVVRNSPLTAGILKKFGITQEEALNKVGDLLEKNVGLPGRYEEKGIAGLAQNKLTPLVDDSKVVDSIVNKANSQYTAFQNEARGRYDNIAQTAPTESFNANNLTKEVGKLSKNLKLGLEGSSTPQATQIVKTITEKYPEGVTNFQDLQQLRSDLSTAAYNIDNPNEKRIVTNILTAVDKDFDQLAETTALSGNKNAAQLLKETNKWYREQSKRFDSDVLDKAEELASGSASPFTTKGAGVLTSAIRNGNIEAVKKIKDLVGEEDFQPLKQQFLQKLLRGNTDRYDIVGFNPKNPEANPLKARIRALKNQKVLEEVLGKEDATTLRALADLSPYLEDASNARKPSKFNYHVAGGLSVPAIIGGVASGGPGAAAVVGTLGTANYVASKIWTSPAMQEVLLKGWKPTLSQQQLSNLAQRLISAFGRESIEKDLTPVKTQKFE